MKRSYDELVPTRAGRNVRIAWAMAIESAELLLLHTVGVWPVCVPMNQDGAHLRPRRLVAENRPAQLVDPVTDLGGTSAPGEARGSGYGHDPPVELRVRRHEQLSDAPGVVQIFGEDQN
jgi:hypothetical protein